MSQTPLIGTIPPMAASAPASGVIVSDPGGYFGGGPITLEEIIALIGSGTMPTGFLRSTQGEVHVTGTLDPMGATATVDLANANWFYGELLEDCTISTTGWILNKGQYIHLELTGGGFLPTVSGVTWVGSAPVAIETGKTTHLILYSRDGGTVIWGSPGGTGGASPTDTQAWMPLTTVVGGSPELVWDADDSLIPTYVSF